MKKISDNIDEIGKAIIRNTSSDLVKVLDVLDLQFEDLYFLIENLSDNDKDKVLTDVINELLENLKSNITIEKYWKIVKDVDEITYYYTSKKEKFDVVIKEGDQIASELLFKVIGHNQQQLDLPIDLFCVKKYCLSSEIKKEQMYDVFLWIIIRYIAIGRCLFIKDYKANKQEYFSSM